jgi:endonuclease/exonuclease/phosphatase (EEP) superfamily protein YafD
VKRLLNFLITTASWLYFLLLFGWLAIYWSTGDHYPWISIANYFGVYLFLPLPLIVLVAIPLHRKSLWLGVLLGAMAFAGLWGGLFLPRARGNHDGAALTVMTYNVLGRQSHAQEQIGTILFENADVVLLQELYPSLAHALGQELADEYPYQVLAPGEGVVGMGVISKFPLRPSGLKLPLQWVGEPQILELDWNGQIVTVVNCHLIPTNSFEMSRIAQDNRYREAQARALVKLASQRGPVIVGGDANTTPLTDAYKILANHLEDGWARAGFGLGHTFPGSDIAGSSRPQIAGWNVPMWLARIDYIFFTPEWRALSAHTARFDGVSDHRGVVVRLALLP